MVQFLFPDSSFGTALAEVTYLLKNGWSRKQVFDYVKTRYYLPDETIYSLIKEGREAIFSSPGDPKYAQSYAERQILMGAVALLIGLTLGIGAVFTAHSIPAMILLAGLSLWGVVMFFRGMFKLT
ncbi:MAG: hypothetical protein K8I82_17880 [Anaerolineae bacterium]|jgi:hypothetical protein|nr:hypothetical protein [Anaerolineae bacterium]